MMDKKFKMSKLGKETERGHVIGMLRTSDGNEGLILFKNQKTVFQLFYMYEDALILQYTSEENHTKPAYVMSIN
jgi:hypothetical protein